MKHPKPKEKAKCPGSRRAIPKFPKAPAGSSNHRVYPLLGADIAEHLDICSKGEAATSLHFRLYSPLLKAIRDNLVSDPDSLCLVDQEGRQVAGHRGFGYSVAIKNPVLHWADKGQPRTLSFDLEVGYEPKEDDDGYDAWRNGWGGDPVKTYRLYCPIDLELEFTEEKFALWVDDTRERQDEARLEKERSQLDALLERHQKYASKKLVELSRQSRPQNCRHRRK